MQFSIASAFGDPLFVIDVEHYKNSDEQSNYWLKKGGTRPPFRVVEAIRAA
jgi:hypothetical protein